MENVNMIDYQVAVDGLRSGHEGGLDIEERGMMLTIGSMEAQFNPPNVENAADLSYSNGISDGCRTVPTGGRRHRNTTDTEQGQQADTPQLGIGEQTSECGAPPTAINRLDRPESSEGEFTIVVAQRGVGDLPLNTTSSVFYEDPAELPVASLPRQHFEHRFEMDGKTEDREPMADETIDLGFGESANEVKTCLSDQEWRALHTAQSSSIRPKIQKAKESESYPNHISFKLPVIRIPDAEFFGFSFSPRFEENSRSLRTQELRPTLNPFERIERQGRCSPLNHSQSPPDSRHHSRSSTMGLQAFRPFPSAMKTSKETGDQPPVIPSPPLLPGTMRGGYGSIGGVESLTVGAKRDSTYGGGLCLGPKSNTEGAFRPNVESLDIKDFDIIFSDEQKLRSCESSSAGIETSGSGLFNASPISNKGLSGVNQSNFVALGVIESAYQVDQRKIMVEVQKEETVSSTGPVRDTNY